MECSKCGAKGEAKAFISTDSYESGNIVTILVIFSGESVELVLVISDNEYKISPKQILQSEFATWEMGKCKYSAETVLTHWNCTVTGRKSGRKIDTLTPVLEEANENPPNYI